MDFAKNLLSKYGWKEGQGIGKNSDGIVKPIKANLKFDNAGLGHDKAKEFTNHWWKTAFNNAANNLNINKTQENVSMSLKSGESVEITTSGFSAKDWKNQKGKSDVYDGVFLKSRSTLHKEAVASNGEAEIKTKVMPSVDTLTDEDLLKACGGRTAHKGARHGLSLTGKLNRIEEQEKQLLEKYSSQFNRDTAQDFFKDWIQVDSIQKSKRKKKNKKKAVEAVSGVVNDGTCITPDSEKLATLLNQDDYSIKYKSKKKKKRHRALDEDLASSLSNLKTSNSPEIIESTSEKNLHSVRESSKSIKKAMKHIEFKKKKKRRKKKFELNVGVIDEDVEIKDAAEAAITPPEAEKYLKKDRKISKKASNSNVNKESIEPHETIATPSVGNKKRKRKSNKVDKATAMNSIDFNDDLSSDCDDTYQEGRLEKKIKEQMEKQPHKRFKIVVENLTPFQSKNLHKAGIDFVLKRDDDPKKLKSERSQFEKIANKLANTMNFEEKVNLPKKNGK